MSLKELLKQAIKDFYPNVYTIGYAENLAKANGYKISNYERRARELTKEGCIKTIRNHKGYITGYIWANKKEASGVKPNYWGKPKQQVLI